MEEDRVIYADLWEELKRISNDFTLEDISITVPSERKDDLAKLLEYYFDRVVESDVDYQNKEISYNASGLKKPSEK